MLDDLKTQVKQLIENAKLNGYNVSDMSPQELAADILAYADDVEACFEDLVAVIQQLNEEIYDNVEQGLVND